MTSVPWNRENFWEQSIEPSFCEKQCSWKEKGCDSQADMGLNSDSDTLNSSITTENDWLSSRAAGNIKQSKMLI